MPGGVSSPVRAFKSVGGEPIVFEKVKGAYAWDVDGNKYIDYVCTWGPSIVGHANDEVLDALRETLVKGSWHVVAIFILLPMTAARGTFFSTRQRLLNLQEPVSEHQALSRMF
jgi:glutamate-1-semialdehyde aminotransferase